MLATEEAYGPDQITTLFFSSHDMPRFISRFGGDSERDKLFAALLLRKRHSSLHSGEFEILKKQEDMIFFIRSAGHERVLVALNFSSEDKSINVQTDNYDLLLSNKRTSLRNGNSLAVMANEEIILLEHKGKTNCGEVHVL